MNDILKQSSWVLGLRGVLAIIFGVLALIVPGLTLLGFMALFAAFALITGVISLIGALKNRKSDDNWGLFLLIGLAGIGAAAVTVVHPALTALVLVLVIGAYALINGVLDIGAAIRLRKTIKNEWMLILSGMTSIIFGVLVFLFPDAGALALVWLISLYAVVTGVLLLAAAYHLHSSSKSKNTEERRTGERRTLSPA